VTLMDALFSGIYSSTLHWGHFRLSCFLRRAFAMETGGLPSFPSSFAFLQVTPN
jgi:hypothetical protein